MKNIMSLAALAGTIVGGLTAYFVVQREDESNKDVDAAGLKFKVIRSGGDFSVVIGGLAYRIPFGKWVVVLKRYGHTDLVVLCESDGSPTIFNSKYEADRALAMFVTSTYGFDELVNRVISSHGDIHANNN